MIRYAKLAVVAVLALSIAMLAAGGPWGPF
jgi:hypothetical protein